MYTLPYQRMALCCVIIKSVYVNNKSNINNKQKVKRRVVMTWGEVRLWGIQWNSRDNRATWSSTKKDGWSLFIGLVNLCQQVSPYLTTFGAMKEITPNHMVIIAGDGEGIITNTRGVNPSRSSLLFKDITRPPCWKGACKLLPPNILWLIYLESFKRITSIFVLA